MSFPATIKIVEVGPRDGLQNEKAIIPTATKIEFINRLSETGLPVIESASFVSLSLVPQLADAHEVFMQINKKSGVRYPVLVPNLEGLQRAIASSVKEISVFTTASEKFSLKNTHCSVSESMERIKVLIPIAKKEKLWIRAYLSCVLGCPYEGEVSPEKTATLARALYELGCDEIALGDTIGVGTPKKTMQLIETVAAWVPIEKLAVHFHDTYGQALVNIYAAMSLGVSIVDSAVSGLGGCPYAKGATGNVATEEVVYMLQGMDIETGVDLGKLIEAGQFISQALNRNAQSKVHLAMIAAHTG